MTKFFKPFKSFKHTFYGIYVIQCSNSGLLLTKQEEKEEKEEEVLKVIRG